MRCPRDSAIGGSANLPDRDKRHILKLMARVAEQAYRRGVQQGAGLAGKPSFRGDLWEWRYRPSLDLSPSGVDRPTMTTSLDRLDAECGEPERSQCATGSVGTASSHGVRGLESDHEDPPAPAQKVPRDALTSKYAELRPTIAA